MQVLCKRVCKQDRQAFQSFWWPPGRSIKQNQLRESLREKLCVKPDGTLGCVRADLTHPTGYGLLFTAWAAALGQINVMLAVARADGATEAGVSRSWSAVKSATAFRAA